MREEIANAGGAISFARYMELALYAPGLGYYSAGMRKFGEEGDYVTAPELSPLFSRCVARQCQQVLEHLGGGDILEAGAGSGAMAADVLGELEKLDALPWRYWILELSAELRSRQREALAKRAPHLADRIQWLDALPLRGFRGVVLANEVLDAMPVHRFRINADDGIWELMVGWSGTQFEWRRSPASGALADRATAVRTLLGDAFAGDYESEVGFAAEGWVRSIADILEKGALFIIDYGFPREEFYHPQRSGGTLMCHYRHRAHPDPLILTGLQDITAHLDFTALADAAREAGLGMGGYTTQAHFLLSLGLQDLASDPDPAQQQLLGRQVRRLVMPDEMGELFKVLGLVRDLDIRLTGFTLQDHAGRL